MQAERETAINRLRGRDRGFKGKHLPAASDIQKLHLWRRINLVMLKKGMQRGPKWALKVSFFFFFEIFGSLCPECCQGLIKSIHMVPFLDAEVAFLRC